jgi:hypothetical protein
MTNDLTPEDLAFLKKIGQIESTPKAAPAKIDEEK